MSELPIHPAAECVRLMDPEELASLAMSIEENGLREPIVLGRVNGAKAEQLVDGRNRLRACELVGVEPQFETMDFADDEAVKAYVADKTEHRHLTKGQQAMRLAFLYPETQRGRKVPDELLKKLETLGKTKHAAEQRLSQARAIRAFSINLALAVRDGVRKLDEALEEVRAARKALLSEEAQLASLQAEAPDLSQLVDEDRMKLTEAFAAFEQRKREEEEKEKNRRETTLRITEDAYRSLISWGNDEFITETRALVAEPEFRRALVDRVRVDPQFLPNIQRGGMELFNLLSSLTEK